MIEFLGTKKARLFGVCLFLFLSVSCSTYQMKLAQPRSLIRQGKIDEAAAELEKLVEQKDGDELLYLMEYGSALRIGAQFKKSNSAFIAADRLADEVDYHSVSRVAMAALGSEEMLQYKGESYEKLLINVNLALNFLMLGQKDSAMVEVRRINEKVNKIRAEGREDYEYNPFAIYLSALIYEADQRYDDAYIAYDQAYKVDPYNARLPEDLIRSARLARRPDALKKWKAAFPEVVDASEKVDRSWGEVILIFEQGWGPKKDFSRGDARYPTLVAQSSETQAAEMSVQAGTRAYQTKSAPVYDLQSAAMKTLDADYKWMIARKLGGFVAKEVVADQIRQKDEVLGLIASLAMHATDRADLRNWTTLPQTYQVARLWLPPGNYKMNLQGLGYGDSPTGDRAEGIDIKVQSKQKSFFAWRSLR